MVMAMLLLKQVNLKLAQLRQFSLLLQTVHVLHLLQI
jgi:hypothetical protein